ncbi:MAG: sugar phosphate isomerase/epimerase [Rhodothermales bacterium]|jgi:sugar phosphate isomerase/epimerase
MNDQNANQQSKARAVNRRTFLQTAAVAAAGSAILPAQGLKGAPYIKRFADVKIGAISYSYRALPSSAEEILGYLVQGGLSTVELMGGPAEAYAGIPEGPERPAREASEAERAEFQQARDAHSKEVLSWRLSAGTAKFAELGRMYADAGVAVDILKLGAPGWSDAEIDYAYNAARAMGARGISFEGGDESAERMGPFATRHALYNGMHNHTQVADPGWSLDRILSHSPYNALNLDIGHYVAGTGDSPVPVIRKYHDRITHLHIKDRRSPANGGDNVSWGEGDTPIAEVLRLIQTEGYPITAMIELEYPVPETSNVLMEVAKCVGFCRGALN